VEVGSCHRATEQRQSAADAHPAKSAELRFSLATVHLLQLFPAFFPPLDFVKLPQTCLGEKVGAEHVFLIAPTTD
jgi:hypothetical protein